MGAGVAGVFVGAGVAGVLVGAGVAGVIEGACVFVGAGVAGTFVGTVATGAEVGDATGISPQKSFVCTHQPQCEQHLPFSQSPFPTYPPPHVPAVVGGATGAVTGVAGVGTGVGLGVVGETGPLTIVTSAQFQNLDTRAKKETDHFISNAEYI